MTPCPECGREFKNASACTSHRVKVHNWTRPVELERQCRGCGASFPKGVTQAEKAIRYCPACQEGRAPKPKQAPADPRETGTPQARAALAVQLRRIEQLEREVPDYDELVEGGRRQREAGMGRKRPAA